MSDRYSLTAVYHGVVTHLESHRRRHACSVDGVRHFDHLVEKQRLRFFDEHGDAAPGRADDLAAVLVRRHGEPDGVDLCVLYEVVRFRVSFHARLEEVGSEAAHLFEVEVLWERIGQRGEPDDLLALQLRQRLHMLETALPHADYADFQVSCH